MYDDGHVYTDKAGSLKWKFAGGPTKEFDASKTPAPVAPAGAAALYQRHQHYLNADAFDRDPDTASMYDDQQVYSRPGESWARSTEEKKAFKKEQDKLKAGAPDNTDGKVEQAISEGDEEGALM